jgi:hypothetical protein
MGLGKQIKGLVIAIQGLVVVLLSRIGIALLEWSPRAL